MFSVAARSTFFFGGMIAVQGLSAEGFNIYFSENKQRKVCVSDQLVGSTP